jgi:YD repeat-containing protein
VDSALADNSAVDFAAFYGQSTGTSHGVTVDQRLVSESFDDNGDTKYRVTQYRLTVDATNLPSGAQVAWRAASGGIDFTNVANPNQEFTVITSGSLPRDFDVKIFYIDNAGNEVIVDWRRVTVTGPNIGTVRNNDPSGTTRIVDETTTSLTVLAKEADGLVSRGANATDDAFAFTRGLYTGPVSDETVLGVLNLSPVESTGAGSEAGTADGGGLKAGYFIENEFDAVGNQIATNQGSGIWRRFGVDANGNQVATYAYGTKEAEEAGAAPVTTFTRFNSINFVTGEYGAAVAIDANGDGTEDATRRAVTLFERDFLDRVILETTPLGTTVATQYNALGLVTSEVATSNGVLSSNAKAYDVLGNQVRETDGNGNSTYTLYDGTRATTEIDGLGNRTQKQYDSFGRHVGTTTAGIQTNINGATQNAQYTMTYDQRDRLVNVNDGMGFDAQYRYDSRDNRILVIDANGNRFGTEFDEMSRVTALTSTQNGAPVRESRTYDFFNNVTSETDAEGRIRYSTFGAFGRRLSSTDEGLRTTLFTYDEFGRLLTRTNSASGQNITNNWDDANRLKSITDPATGVNTTYTYDVDGNRATENITTPLNLYNRSVRYTYDGLGRMMSWNDSAQGQNLSYLYDGAGNLRRVSGSDSTNHWYFYDANNRQTAKANGPNLATATTTFTYTYDGAGNRTSENDTKYAFDLNSRVVGAGTTAAGTTVSWAYDRVGNVLSFNNNGDVTSYSYYENNRNWLTNNVADQTVTTLTLDKTGRVITTVIVDDSGDDTVTSTFRHFYFADGREWFVSGSGGGDSTGSSFLDYDANDNLKRIDLGQGDLQEQAEIKTFVYNNESQILYRAIETGETEDSVGDDNDPRLDSRTSYFYANSNPVGERKIELNEDGSVATDEVLLDEGRYSLVRTIGEDYPSTGPIAYEVQRGDTLKSIADRLYGNPSLWFIIAEANGLMGAERLEAGSILQVPNTVNAGRITDETHVVYDQNEITGSTLPNLKSPEPDACAKILAVILIILIIIIAIVVAVVTYGAASAIAGAIASVVANALAATLLTVAAVAVVGSAIAFVGALLTQGLLIAFGVQDEIDWTSVGAEAAAGAFAGIAAGIGAALKVGTTAAKLASLGVKVSKFVKVLAVAGSAVSDAGGEALRQFIVDGEITSFASIAGAAVGSGLATASVLKAANSGAKAASKASALGRNIDDVTKAASKASKVTAGRFDVVDAAAGIVTEWVKVAEIAARNEGEVTTADWATAIAGTVAAGINLTVGLSGKNDSGSIKFDNDGVFVRNARRNIAETGDPRVARNINAAPDTLAVGIPKDVLRRNNVARSDLVPVTPRLLQTQGQLDANRANLNKFTTNRDAAGAQLTLDRNRLDAETESLARANSRLGAESVVLNVEQRRLLAVEADAGLESKRTRIDEADEELARLQRDFRRAQGDLFEQDANLRRADGQAESSRQLSDANLGPSSQGVVTSLQVQRLEADLNLRRQTDLFEQSEARFETLQRQVTAQERLTANLREDFNTQEAAVLRQRRVVEEQRIQVETQRSIRDRQQGVVDQAQRTVATGESRFRELKALVDSTTQRGTAIAGDRDSAVREAVVWRDLVKNDPTPLDPPGKAFRDAFNPREGGPILSNAIDRGVDIVTTLVLLAAFDGDTAFGFLATGRVGKTNTGQSGRAALANAFSLSTSNGKIRVVATPRPASSSYNTGPLQRSLIGVPVPEAEDPGDGLEQLAATVGRDEQTNIPTGRV